MDIIVKKYNGNTGIFKSEVFEAELKTRLHTMKYSGVVTHGQNVVTATIISTVANSARTMMIHQALLWPKKINLSLWNFTLNYTTYLWNRLSNGREDILPFEMYAATHLDYTSLQNKKETGMPSDFTIS